MSALRAALALVLTSALIGCASLATAPQSPAQAVYAAHGDYIAALSIAVAYKSLPPCRASDAGVVAFLCASPLVVAGLQRADDAAFAALSTAQALVRSPGVAGAVAGSITLARRAVDAFAAIAESVKGAR